ncbi:HTH domain-containing protein [Paenibacillus hemerocallicola]|uniref:HTH domain-containing protein n=2 Tax=Paenibacillus hemerocallicola TaxID=1172614 RepID=A0A5C4TBK8_9BACL|nr:HTH domain-containing protein [Paenibacillus hemerocallicola]
MGRLDGMLSILRLLKANEKMTAETMAEILEISVRTVYRYIDLLNVSGVPIIAESGHGGGFQLPATFSSVPLFLTPRN